MASQSAKKQSVEENMMSGIFSAIGCDGSQANDCKFFNFNIDTHTLLFKVLYRRSIITCNFDFLKCAQYNVLVSNMCTVGKNSFSLYFAILKLKTLIQYIIIIETNFSSI